MRRRAGTRRWCGSCEGDPFHNGGRVWASGAGYVVSNVHSRRRQHAMLVRKVAAGALAGTLVVGLAGPAIAKGRPDAKGPKAKVRGTTSLMFTESVKNKLAKDGIKVEAVAPAQKVNKVKFVFPGVPDPAAVHRPHRRAYVHPGRCQSHAAQNVDVMVPGVGPVEDVFNLGTLKVNKKTRHLQAEGRSGQGRCAQRCAEDRAVQRRDVRGEVQHEVLRSHMCVLQRRAQPLT